MKRVGLMILVTLAIGATVWSSSGGPPNGRTGAPGEGLCTDCHSSFPPNSGDGSLTISGLPVRYDSGMVYSLSVTLADPGQQRWGLELAIKNSGNQQAGTITVTDATNTQTSTSGGITYLKQTSVGTYSGTPNGPVSWNFNWTAPGSSTGRVWFYVAGNAANGNGSTSGDYIYNIAWFRDPPFQGTSTQPTGKIILVFLILSTALFMLMRRQLLPKPAGT